VFISALIATRPGARGNEAELSETLLQEEAHRVWGRSAGVTLQRSRALGDAVKTLGTRKEGKEARTVGNEGRKEARKEGRQGR